MAKTLKDIQTALKHRYAGLLKEKDGKSYIPWDQAVKVANDLFDPDGYDLEIRSTNLERVPNMNNTRAFGYAAVVRVTVYPTDDRPFFRDGQGFNELSFTASGVAMIDPAIKGAASGAALRALVLLGDAFGLFLYNEKANGSSLSPQTSIPPDKPALSEAQIKALRNRGFSAEQINQITQLSDWKRRKAVMDDVFAKDGDGKLLYSADAILSRHSVSLGGVADDHPF